RARQAGAQHQQRHDGKPSHGTLRQLQFSAERIAGVCPHLGGIITAALPAHYGLVVHRRPQKASAALRRGRSLRATDRCDAASPFPPYGPQRENQPLPPPLSALTSVVPSAAGLSATAMPADFMASTLSLALPLPPEMMAPAWPMRRPGGAVMPAMNPAIGFLRPLLASDLMKSAASSSAAPPISPIMMMALVSGSARNISSTSMNSVPFTGSPPMPTAVDCPSPASVVCLTAS